MLFGYRPLLCCRYTFFTSHDYVCVADVECQIMFFVVTLYCFMCNIALVTFLGLQYWSASMTSIYEHRRMCIFCVLSLVKLTKVSWNFPKIWTWNFTSCCWEPCNWRLRVQLLQPPRVGRTNHPVGTSLHASVVWLLMFPTWPTPPSWFAICPLTGSSCGVVSIPVC